MGSEPLDPIDRERARVLASGGVARDELAGVLHELDNVVLARPTARRPMLPAERVLVVGGVPCADALQTLVDLARCLDDDRWEQALESALRRGLVTIAELEAISADPARVRRAETSRIRRVLGIRPPGAPPTGSLLETFAVQLARTVPDLPVPIRQLIVRRHDLFVAQLDLCWPELGLFLELDGQQHKDQPVDDARRETAVVAATGWLCGRFTWHEVVVVPRTTARRLADLAAMSRRRPVAPLALGPTLTGGH